MDLQQIPKTLLHFYNFYIFRHYATNQRLQKKFDFQFLSRAGALEENTLTLGVE